ncbi:YIP1 family protein [Jhaorihella thermophila]|uniref:Yip1 domain-containing protein n=1 Tax=Jhaorihella thermophila TaxID=488547 RepID=A0A1H5SBI3_9RHOB|nr:YIP1 family protein [Jhaorihella thermophila]SEF48023.1 Yip1 domain-containing protein [Jhaorihella thermophila]
MTLAELRSLTVLSVTVPAEAARRILALRLPRGVLWSALLLAAALNAILFALSNILLPTPHMMPWIFQSPLVYFGLVVLALVAFIQALVWVGQGLGGQGGTDEIMAVIVWMQYLRVLVQAASLVLMLVFPILSLVLVMAATVIGVWILLHFIAQAHRLDGLGRAAFVVILSGLAVIIAASLFMALVLGPFTGDMSHV